MLWDRLWAADVPHPGDSEALWQESFWSCPRLHQLWPWQSLQGMMTSFNPPPITRSCCFGNHCVINVIQLVIDWEGTHFVARENQDSARRIRKSIWIKRTPNNMNRDGGTYQLSDIYDAVIAKTTTSGDRKLGGLLQSANQCPRKMSEL